MCSEQSKVDLTRDLEQRMADSNQVKTLQSHIDGMTCELADVSTKLQEAAVQLNKEKARNKAVVEHTSVSSETVFGLLGILGPVGIDGNPACGHANVPMPQIPCHLLVISDTCFIASATTSLGQNVATFSFLVPFIRWLTLTSLCRQ